MKKITSKNPYETGWLDIDYDEGDQASYRCTKLCLFGKVDNTVIVYSSKPSDPAGDFNRALRHGFALNLVFLGGKSSVDHFTMDGEDYEWEDQHSFELLKKRDK